MARRKGTTDDAIELAAIFLGQCRPREDIKRSVERYLHDEYPAGMPERTFKRVLAKARIELAKLDGTSRRQMRTKSYRFYDSIIRDPATPVEVKLRAQRCIDLLYGLCVKRVIHSGTGEGGAIRVEQQGERDLSRLTVEELKTFRMLMAKIELKDSAMTQLNIQAFLIEMQRKKSPQIEGGESKPE